MNAATFIGVVLVTAVSIFVARRLAVRKGRLPGPWGLAALLVGPVVVLVLALMPTRKGEVS